MRYLIGLCALLVSVLAANPSFAENADPATSPPTSSATAGEAEPAKEAAPAKAAPAAPKEAPTALSQFNSAMEHALFFDVFGGLVQVDVIGKDGQPFIDPETGENATKAVGFPFLVLILALGAIFFSFWFRFINFRGFKHAIDVVRGRYDNPEDIGEISHFQALTSALSATVGLGNIAGVAVAIVRGGPGAVVWMMLLAALGMSAKFSSCTLALLYRKVNQDGSISGGPMYYLDLGLKKIGLGALGKGLAVLYAFMIMGGAMGGGNMFQSNQTVEALTTTFASNETLQWIATRLHLEGRADWAIGIVMAVFVAMVILGGIKRIGAATSKIVPAMVGIYVVASLFIIAVNVTRLPDAVALMFKMAFTSDALYGGILGVLVQGVQRAAFSNEAGIGSASVAHAAAKTDEPVREGLVAMLGPFIDTIVVCFMTAMVVIITDQWQVSDAAELQGAAITAGAFATAISWFPYVLSVSIALFAYSTMISWCYYGERGWIYLLDHFNGAGLKSVIVFRIFFVLAVVVGAVNPLKDVLAFSDIMVLSMAFPNILGSILLAPKVRERLNDYWSRYKAGQMPTYDAQRVAPAAAE